MLDDPTRHLTEPRPPDGLDAGHFTAAMFMDAVSLTHWLNEAIDGMTGHNLLEELIEPLVGNWEATAKFGIAVANTGDCLQTLGTNIQQTIVTLDASWDGNASDAAYRYFSGLAADVSRARTTLRAASEQYDDLSHGMWTAVDTLSGLVKQIVDGALIALIAAAAGTVTAETGAGAVIGYGLAALEIVRILTLINRCAIIVSSCNTAIFGFIGTVKVLSNEVGDLKGVTLPRAGYDHPAVA